MKNRGVGHALLFLAAWLCAILAAPAALADDNVRIVRLSYVEGDVQIDRGTGQGFEAAVMNMPVTQGARLWAQGENGLVEIEFEGGSTVRLVPDSGLNVLELARRDSGGRLSLVELQQGTAYFDIRPKDDDEFRVTFNGYEVQVPHSAHFRLTVDRQSVKLAVFKGELVVPHSESSVQVRTGETLTLDLGDPDRYYLAQEISEGAFDPWDHDRESYRENYRESTYNPGYSADYSYGVTELNYWGSYSYISGWGWMWQPYSIWAGWNPWMDGAWVWYPGLGYVWVSAYPWGWMPYRYGYWFFISGHGWCWRPGRHWNNWVPVTVAQNPPPNFHPVAPPRPGGGPIVAVGHGPQTLFPNPQGPNWHGPVRQPVVGAPGTPVLVGGHPLPGPRGPANGPVAGSGTPATGPTGPTVTPALRNPMPTPEPGTGATGGVVSPTPAAGGMNRPPASGPATGQPVGNPGAVVVKGPPIAPAPPPHIEPAEPAPRMTPAAPPPAATPPSAGSGSGAWGGSSRGSTPHVSPPSPPPSPPPAPAAAPRSTGGSSGGYSGGSHYSSGSSSGYSGGSHSSAGSSSGSSGGYSGGSHSSGSSSSGGSHSSGSSSSSSSGSHSSSSSSSSGKPK